MAQRVDRATSDGERGAAPGGRAAWIVAVVVVAVLLVLYALPLLDGDGGPDAGIALIEVVEDADEVIGEQIVVSGEVGELVDEEAFTIGGAEFGAPPVLVLHRGHTNPGDREPRPGDVVQVVAVPRAMTPAELERALGDDVPDARVEALARQPVLVSDTVVVERRAGRQRGSRPTPRATSAASSPAA